MQAVATIISNPQAWFGLAFAALLLFAFRANRAAKALELTVVDQTRKREKQAFSLLDAGKLVVLVAALLAMLYALKRLDFVVTLAVIIGLCLHTWLTGYRSKIRRLQKLGLSATDNAILIATFTTAVSSFFVGLAMFAWIQHAAP